MVTFPANIASTDERDVLRERIDALAVIYSTDRQELNQRAQRLLRRGPLSFHRWYYRNEFLIGLLTYAAVLAMVILTAILMNNARAGSALAAVCLLICFPLVTYHAYLHGIIYRKAVRRSAGNPLRENNEWGVIRSAPELLRLRAVLSQPESRIRQLIRSWRMAFYLPEPSRKIAAGFALVGLAMVTICLNAALFPTAVQTTFSVLSTTVFFGGFAAICAGFVFLAQGFDQGRAAYLELRQIVLDDEA